MTDDDVFYHPPSRGMQNYGSVSPGSFRHEDSFTNGNGVRGQSTCPTCRGSGYINRDEENELVALIPVRDKRLKPRRTALYVVFAVTVCLVIGGLLMFFLLPRSVVLSSDIKRLKPLSVNISVPNKFVNLTIRNEYNVSNENFFPISVTRMDVHVLFDGKEMLQTTNRTTIQIPLRATRIYSLDFNIIFQEDMGDLAYYCNAASSFGHTIWMPFQATAYTSYYGHTEESTLSIVQQVQCSGKSD